MEKQRIYYPVRFSAETLRRAEAAFRTVLPANAKEVRSTWSISRGNDKWTFDSPEEFFAEYQNRPDSAFVWHSVADYTYHFQIVRGPDATVTVEAPTRREIESVFAVFDAAEQAERIPKETRKQPKLFIGHGQNAAWRDLKDHLQDQHGFDIVAYETGARAGHTIRDILEEMLEDSSFAILVLTAEDENVDGARRARQNVVHEVGLFQGRLGFARAIVLLEDGTEEFSNIAGMQQIRFAPGRIRETFGDVLATIRREFGTRGVS